MVSPPSSITTSSSSNDFSCTQEAIDHVQNQISDLKDTLKPTTSARQEQVVNLGREVDSLKREVFYLRESLHNSNRQNQILRNRLEDYERREEEELINRSISYENERDANNRYHNYVKYAPRNFSNGFVTSKQSRP